MTKLVTKAERVAWMSRTSEVVGSHLKTDLESYLTLIRRKVQEKCSTTHELITLIRRSKIGDSKFVTPNEFRFTLIKFGIIISQPLVDVIFNVFDSDRSGSMDFDEFAMWIMNSEFKPSLHAVQKSKGVQIESPDEQLRKKVAVCVQQHGDVFALMKSKISFLELVSEINRKDMRLTDVQVRQLFLKLDPKNTGFIDTPQLLHWARGGAGSAAVQSSQPTATSSNSRNSNKPRSSSPPSLLTCINLVSVRNSKQMERCFSHIPEGAGVRIQFEEFRRCLVTGGLGNNPSDVKDLFRALGGSVSEEGVSEAGAKMDLLFEGCKKLHLPDKPRQDLDSHSSTNQLAGSATNASTSTATAAAIDKRASASYVSVSRAARHLRDAMRKCFGEVKAALLAKDPENSGFVSAVTLHEILVQHCLPISFHDFRFIVQQLKTEDGASKIDWHSFLHLYNPKRAPHQLSNNLGQLTLTLPTQSPSHSQSSQFASTVIPISSSNNISDRNAEAAFVESLKQPSEVRPATTTSSEPRKLKSLRRSQSNPRPVAPSSASSSELRRVWSQALRFCHKHDPQRSGCVSKDTFLAALQFANHSPAMAEAAMHQLAEQYGSAHQQVQYLSCFRDFLTDLTAQSFQLNSSSGEEEGGGAGLLPAGHACRPSGPLHPWDFQYKRERHMNPYWTAAATAKDNFVPTSPSQHNQQASTGSAAVTTVVVPPASVKPAGQLTEAEKAQLLSQYSPRLLSLCSRCFSRFSQHWKALRNDLTRAQITSQRGSIMADKFLAILEQYGCAGTVLSKDEWGSIVRAFRGMGLQDVVKFDDFLRVCLLVKSSLVA